MTRIESAEGSVDLQSLQSRVIAGDQEASGEFYQYALGRVPKGLFRSLPDPEDFVQTIAIKATNRFHLFQLPPTTPQEPQEPNGFDRAINSWIYTIALNTRRDFFRKQARGSTFDSSDMEGLAD